MAVTVERPAGDATIRPFTVEIPEADLEDLRARIAATRWPERETVDDDSQGVPLALMQDLARYWRSEYDWRPCEARLNALPNFVTEIDGLDIHFIHVPSRHEDALPIVLCHGWPGSIVEQLKIVGPLTDPTAHGAGTSDAFHVVIPSMPGFGFSGKPTRAGWGPVRIADAYVELMKRLGYERFVAQGGDWGAIVVDAMAGGPRRPDRRRAGATRAHRHPHQHGRRGPAGPLYRVRRRQSAAIWALRGGTEHLPAAAHVLREARRVRADHGDASADALRTGGFTALAACMVEHGDGTGQPGLVQHVLEQRLEQPSDLTRDDILDNITLFWLTNTGVSSARVYWENKLPFFAAKGVQIPVGVSSFPDEIYRVPRTWAQRAYPNLVHFSRHARGGHFAAWEQPQLLSEDVRETFRPLRRR